MTICRTIYQPKDETAEAVSVDVTFSQECSQQMVTVCTPQAPGYGGYHGQGYHGRGGHKHGGGGSYQKCKEVAQETCYNKPAVSPDRVQV